MNIVVETNAITECLPSRYQAFQIHTQYFDNRYAERENAATSRQNKALDGKTEIDATDRVRERQIIVQRIETMLRLSVREWENTRFLESTKIIN